MKIIKVKESVSVKLTQQEISERAELAAKLHEEIEAKTSEAKDVSVGFKHHIDTLKNEQTEALREVRTG
jgi:hypothetical protein